MKQHTDSIVAAVQHEAPSVRASDSRCHLAVITSNAEFDLLEDRWNDLLDRADASVFQTFEWVRTWWKYFDRPSDRLHILLFTSGGRLVGIAPLFRERRGIPGARAYARLQFLGRGLSDYAEFILEPGFEYVVFTAFAHYLRSTAHLWDVFDMEDVNERSPLVRLLPQILENHGIMIYRYQGNVCPVIDLPSGSDALLQKIGPTASYNFKRKLRKLQQAFEPDVVLYRDEADDIEAGIEEFALVHGARWKSQGYPSAFDDPALKAFHVEFSRKFARRGWLRLFVLRVDGTPVALNYAFNYRERIYMYHSNAQGPEEVMKCSPGFLIRSIAMAEGITEGMKIFDFLRGDEAYKYKEWKATDTKNYLIRASSPAALSRPRFVLFLTAELLGKCGKRIQREYYEYRRFRIVERRSALDVISYIASRLSDLLVLGYNFVIRHTPSPRIQRYQINRHRSGEREDARVEPADESKHDTRGNGRRDQTGQ